MLDSLTVPGLAAAACTDTGMRNMTVSSKNSNPENNFFLFINRILLYGYVHIVLLDFLRSKGVYQITEMKTEPDKALLKEPIMVTLPMTMIEQEANEYGNVDFDSAKEDVGYTNKWYFYNCKYDITNNAVFKMPMTGDDGKWKYGFIGFGMVAALGCAYVILNSKNYKKRKYRKIKK